MYVYIYICMHVWIYIICIYVMYCIECMYVCFYLCVCVLYLCICIRTVCMYVFISMYCIYITFTYVCVIRRIATSFWRASICGASSGPTWPTRWPTSSSRRAKRSQPCHTVRERWKTTNYAGILFREWHTLQKANIIYFVSVCMYNMYVFLCRCVCVDVFKSTPCTFLMYVRMNDLCMHV